MGQSRGMEKYTYHKPSLFSEQQDEETKKDEMGGTYTQISREETTLET